MPAARSRPLSITDIRSMPRPSAATMPAIARLAGKLAESYGASLASLHGAPWRVTLDHIAEDASPAAEDAGEWFRVETHLGSMTLHVALDRIAVSACCEAALGGSGAEQPYDFPGRPYSAIEKALIRLTLQCLEARTTAALSDELATPASQFEGLVDPEAAAGNGETLGFLFLVNVFGYSGELLLTANSAEIAAQFGSANIGTATDLQYNVRAALQRRIAESGIDFKITLDVETFRVDELASLKPGRHMALTSSIHTPVFVCCGDVSVFKASLTRSGDRLAVRVIAPAE